MTNRRNINFVILFLISNYSVHTEEQYADRTQSWIQHQWTRRALSVSGAVRALFHEVFSFLLCWCWLSGWLLLLLVPVNDGPRENKFLQTAVFVNILTLRVISGMSYPYNESNILMCVILHLLICTALRAHITVVEMLYKIKCYIFVVLKSVRFWIWSVFY